MFWAIAILVVSIASCVFAFMSFAQPARNALWSKIRVGLTYVHLLIRRGQYDDNESRRKK